MERDRPALDRAVLRGDDPERPLRVPLDEGAVRLGGRDVAHAACDHVDHARRAAAARLADGAPERVLGERRDHVPRDLLGVAGPAVRGGPGDPELCREVLHAEAFRPEEAAPGGGEELRSGRWLTEVGSYSGPPRLQPDGPDGPP